MATPFKIDGAHGEDEAQNSKTPATETPTTTPQPAVPAQTFESPGPIGAGPMSPEPISPGSKLPEPIGAVPSAEVMPEITVETPQGPTLDEPDAIPHASAPASLMAKTPPETGEKKKSKTLFWIIVALLFLLILAVGIASFYAQQQGTTLMGLFGSEEDGEDMEDAYVPAGAEGEDAEEEGNNNEEEAEEAVVVEPNFTGDYVTATLPEEWSIVEYVNGDGSEILVGGVAYQGLTGLEILDADAGTVFTLSAVYGIGGIEACSEYYEFSDSSLSYYQEVETAANEIGTTPTIIQVADGSYSEFTLFDLRIRRVGSALYWDLHSSDPSSFDAACGMSTHIFVFNELQFSADGNSLGNYQFELNSSVNEANLTALEDVLESLEIAI